MPTVSVTGTYTVASGTTVSVSNADGFSLDGSNAQTVTNNGTIQVSATSNYATALNGFRGGTSGAVVTNSVGASILINDANANGSVHGFNMSSPFFRFQNDGTFSLTANGDAMGTWDDGYPSTTVNNGLFNVSGRNVTGVLTFGDFVNTGIFTVSAHGTGIGIGVEVGYVIFSFNNSGTITVTDQTSALDSVGLYLNAYSGDRTGRTIINSGVITADYSIAADAFDTGGAGSYAIVNQASGVLNGTVYLLGGNDVVTNEGHINGQIILGDGNNTYNGANGHVTGLIFGGTGNNTITGGADDETLVATLNPPSTHDGLNHLFGGGGNDWLLGGNNVDELNGGDGDDLIYGYGGADSISGGAGDDYIIAGAGDDVVDGGTQRTTNGDVIDYSDCLSGVSVDLSITTAQNTGGGGIDTLKGIESVYGSPYDDTLVGNSGANALVGGRGNDVLDGGAGASDSAQYVDATSGVTVSLALSGPQNVGGGEGIDTLRNIESLFGSRYDDVLTGNDAVNSIGGGNGNDRMDGGGNIDTAVYLGLRSAYTITHNADGSATVTGPEGTDTLLRIEYIHFSDQTVRFHPGIGQNIDVATAAPSTFMGAIRDFDGNDLGAATDWVRIGQVDLQGDGDLEQVFVNRTNGRWASVGVAEDGKVYFGDYGWAGDTRVVGIYVDPLVQNGTVTAGGPFDSQRRFQNDLSISNIKAVLGGGDYDHDGLQEVYFSLNDGTAYLHAYMHADGNIRYANYQNQQQVIDYLTSNGFGASTYAGWFS